jgi:hypothetical protein
VGQGAGPSHRVGKKRCGVRAGESGVAWGARPTHTIITPPLKRLSKNCCPRVRTAEASVRRCHLPPQHAPVCTSHSPLRDTTTKALGTQVRVACSRAVRQKKKRVRGA